VGGVPRCVGGLLFLRVFIIAEEKTTTRDLRKKRLRDWLCCEFLLSEERGSGDEADGCRRFTSHHNNNNAHFHANSTRLYPAKPTQPTAKMKRNIVIFLIIIILFLLIALIGYGIYYLQTRMAVGGTASTTSGSEMTSVV
jgi:hypothetical protein